MTRSSELQTPFTIEDMRRFAGEAWGQLGADIVDKWCEFNATYFDGALRPVPLVITNTLPFGKRIAFCSYNPGASGRTITLNLPKDHNVLVADNNTLLHEMLHQCLFERGEDAKHAGTPWRREIMRLTKVITGKEIWAGRSKTARRDGRIIRLNEPHPQSGEPSLPQAIIARWPHDGLGIDFGQFDRRATKCRVTQSYVLQGARPWTEAVHRMPGGRKAGRLAGCRGRPSTSW